MFKTRLFSIFVVAVTLFSVGAMTQVFAQGRYANRYSRNDVNNIIQRLEESSNTFRSDFSREMGSYRGPQERQYNQTVANFENSLDRLRKRFDRDSGNWWQSRNEVQSVISTAQAVNGMINNLQFRRNVERQWNRMRDDLNKLADTYDLPGLNGGGWNGGYNGGNNGGYNDSSYNNGRRGNVPSWAQGTFYGRNPESGGVITMNVNRSGSVSISFDGNQPVFASMNGTTLRNGQYVSRVSQINNGIRTTDVNNGSYIDYYRTPINGGINGGYNNGNNGGYNGGQGNVPSWAQGTFYGRNPETGGTIILTVQRNGSVTISFDGQSAVYASMNGTTLTNGQYVSRVSQINNGIRTTDVNNGSYIDYRRR